MIAQGQKRKKMMEIVNKSNYFAYCTLWEILQGHARIFARNLRENSRLISKDEKWMER